MFKKPLSFEGRIRRREFGLSFLFYMIVNVVMQLSMEEEGMTDTQAITFLCVMLPLFFVFIAQAVKRSHDVGNNGWYVLIPFYMLWLLFADSVSGPNQYGDNPKGIGNEPTFTFENTDGPSA